MENRTAGVIATIATLMLCGCPGLFLLCYGSIAAVVGVIPGAKIDMLGSDDPTIALAIGLGLLGLGILFIAIPVVIAYFTLSKKPETIHDTTPFKLNYKQNLKSCINRDMQDGQDKTFNLQILKPFSRYQNL